MNYHKIVRSLISQLRDARQEIENLQSRIVDQENYYEERLHEVKRSADRAYDSAQFELQEERDRRYADENRLRDIATKLDRAREWGDNYEVDRLTRQLKRGW